MDIDRILDIEKYISDNIATNYINQKQTGEVFTPYEIINHMLNKLEETNKDIFTDKNNKFLDNSVGVGFFMICIYFRLMRGLRYIIKNPYERKKHILENMLYMIDINQTNINICNSIFNNNKNFKVNIYCYDALTYNYANKFTVIIGNPPYQKQNKKNNNARGGTNNNLYIDFIKFNISLLQDNGYLVYIHPLNWRKINSEIFQLFLTKNLLHISLNYGGSLFKNVTVNTDFYILQNNNKYNTSNIECYDKKNKLLTTDDLKIKINFMPNIFNKIIQDLLIKINKYGVNKTCILNSDCHKIREHVKSGKDNIYKYPLYNTSGNPYEFFSSKPHKDQYIKKVIMSCSGKLSPIYDDGKLGTTQDSMYFIVETQEEGLFLVDILNSNLYKFLIKICQWGNFRNEVTLFNYLKYPNSIDINNYFKLNKEEIDFVNKNK